MNQYHNKRHFALVSVVSETVSDFINNISVQSFITVNNDLSLDWQTHQFSS